MGEYKVTFEDGGEGLLHYRTPGSKNGVRKYQNPDGSLTPEGYRHYGINPNTGRSVNSPNTTNISKVKESYIGPSAATRHVKNSVMSNQDRAQAVKNIAGAQVGKAAADLTKAGNARSNPNAKTESEIYDEYMKSQPKHLQEWNKIASKVSSSTENQRKAELITKLKGLEKMSPQQADYVVNKLGEKGITTLVTYYAMSSENAKKVAGNETGVDYYLDAVRTLAKEMPSNYKLGDANKDVIADSLKKSKVASKSSGSSVKATAKTLATKAKAAVNSVKDKASSFLKKLFGR